MKEPMTLNRGIGNWNTFYCPSCRFQLTRSLLSKRTICKCGHEIKWESGKTLKEEESGKDTGRIK